MKRISIVLIIILLLLLCGGCSESKEYTRSYKVQKIEKVDAIGSIPQHVICYLDDGNEFPFNFEHTMVYRGVEEAVIIEIVADNNQPKGLAYSSTYLYLNEVDYKKYCELVGMPYKEPESILVN